ncbi:MAG: hypothetical protein QNJ57_02745 [Flavobacteriaceae bacterium]|nr:hypothetical protein [Flavobacteriaceae bacterium]
MKRIALLILSLFICANVVAQGIPQWFYENMEKSIGNWVASNKKYQNQDEPMEAYGMKWEWGAGKKSITGKLYGYMNGKRVGPFWEFRQYWDFKENKGIVVQYAPDGTVGIGPLKVLEDGKIEIKQVFTSPDGNQTQNAHRSSLTGNEFTTTSFLIDDSGNWTENRSYTWHLHRPIHELGELSLSLTVKDIKLSKEYYQKLGFFSIDGNVDQKWLILQNGPAKIGLFQGMFPKNTITFNPANAREIYNTMIEGKIETQMTIGLDKPSGKASFMITDPDGNPILIDQHQ